MATKTAALRFGPHLKELRVHCCQTSKESHGLREFVKKYYPDLKSSNPDLPILIRECSGVRPKIWARFEYGRELSSEVSNKGPEDVLQELQSLVSVKTK